MTKKIHWHGMKMKLNIIKWAISIVAVVLAVTHVLYPQLKIDGVTVMLLGIACLPLLEPLFKRVELPGGLKIEYKELLAAEKKVEQTGLVSLQKKKPINNEKRHVYSFESVAGTDLNLALSGLRIEIESRLRKLAESHGIAEERVSLQKLAQELVRKCILSNDEASAVNDLLPILNRAAHGAIVDGRASEWSLEFGTRLLDALEERLGEISIPQLLEQWHKRDGAANTEIGTDLSKALVRSPRAFLAAMQKDRTSFNAWLDGIQQNTFTMYESRGEVDDELYTAYYLKLKSLMQNAVTPLLGTDLDELASKVIDSLDKVVVRRIW